MSALGALIVDLEQQALGELVLNAEVPVLHIGHSQVAGDGVLRGRLYFAGIEGAELLIGASGRHARDVDAGHIV